MTKENFAKCCLAALAWRESHRYNGNDATAKVIAQMIKHRQLAGWGTLLECCAGYYTFADRHPTVPELTYMPSEGDLAWRRFLTIVDDIAVSQIPDMINGGLYCSDLHDVREWFQTHIVGEPEIHSRCAQIGQLTFFT